MAARASLVLCLLAVVHGLVVNRSLQGDDVATPMTYSWTAWFSDEHGYSEDRHYAILGAHCRGSYCDDLQLYQGSGGVTPISSSPDKSWTHWFSEEGDHKQSCPSGHIVTQVDCSGHNCDNKRLRCEMVSSTSFTLGTPVWEGTKFSEEGDGQYMCSMLYGVVTGWACYGSKCDYQKLQCAPLTPKAYTPLAPATFSWTGFFGSSEEYSPSSHYPITAVSCKGDYCGSLSLHQGTSGSDIEVLSASYWTDLFSEEGGHTGSCKHNYVVTRVFCSGKNCDNKKLQCSAINTAKIVMSSSEFSTVRFSEEWLVHMGQCPSDGYFVTGMKCYGKRCDDLQIICKRVSPLGTFPSNPATSPVGMWLDIGQYFKSTQRTTTLEMCTQDSHGQQADRSRTDAFSNEVSLSLEIKQTSGIEGVASVDTTYGFAYTASSETSQTVSNSILSSSMQSECRKEVISCDDDCWGHMLELQPGTASAHLWQWVVVEQVGADPLRNLGSFVFVPEGIKPFCPPGTQILGDSTMTQCKTGTLSTKRRLFEPMHLV